MRVGCLLREDFQALSQQQRILQRQAGMVKADSRMRVSMFGKFIDRLTHLGTHQMQALAKLGARCRQLPNRVFEKRFFLKR